MPKKRSPWLKCLAIAVVAVAAYFINVEVQSYLGQKAFVATGLPTHDLASAQQLAASEGKLVLADLSAVWCPSCRALDKRVLSDADVQQAIAEKYVFVRVEFESPEGEAFKAKYNVSGFPTLLALKPDGEKIRQIPLRFDPQAFIQQL